MDKINTILGIDPGTTIMGFAIITVQSKKISIVTMDVIDLRKIENPYEKLKTIFIRISALIDQYKPDELAIEAPFYGLNVQSMLKLGRAQGVAIAAALYKDIPIFEYLPKKIKQSITGNGNASKEQVAAMLERLLKIEETPKYFDATDGLAVAVCHYFQRGQRADDSNLTGWSAFLSKNPDRLIKK